MPAPAPLTLTHHTTTAVIDPIGAGLRSLSVDGHTVIPDYDTATTPAYAGVVMFPWAGRTPDGIWRDGDTMRTLPVNDTDTPSAIHGLVAFETFQVTSHEQHRVSLGYDLLPTDGYPYQLRLEVTYALDDTGLTISDQVTNTGGDVAPFALAHHPYFALGEAAVTDVSVEMPARGMMTRTEKLIPVSETDFGAPGITISPARKDDTYRIDFQGGEIATSTLHTPAGVIEIWQESAWPWLHVYQGDDFPSVVGTQPVVALEVHTAVPNGLNWPGQLIRLAGGETWSADWGIRFTAPGNQEKP